MIDVFIREVRGKLHAICTIEADDDDEFWGDVETLKSIPPSERAYKDASKEWTIFDAEKFRTDFPELTTAIDEYRKQLKLWKD